MSLGLSSGVCCVTALIVGKEMVVSNLGDCRAVLCRDGIAEAITTDHKPEREDERRRIEDKVCCTHYSLNLGSYGSGPPFIIQPPHLNQNCSSPYRSRSISTRIVQALTEVEAFVLMADDLKCVAPQFRRLHSK